MAATGIKEVRPTHEAILDLVLTRPHGTLRELGQLTGYSVSWLSQVMRSDCFRAAYDARRGDIEAEVMMGIGDRLNALSHLAIDKIEAELLKTEDPNYKLDAFDKILHRTGYAPNASKSAAGAPQVVVQNNFTLSREDLAEFRGKVIEGQTPVRQEGLPALEAPPSGSA